MPLLELELVSSLLEKKTAPEDTAVDGGSQACARVGSSFQGAAQELS